MKVVRISITMLLVFSVLFTMFEGQYKISGGSSDNTPEEYKGIITIWHVDSFEGGTGSRKQFLLKVARNFEKKYSGVLVMVSDYTAEGIKDSIDKGIYPDAISFGVGTEISGFGEIAPQKEVEGGKVGGRSYATAWCRGGYVLIANPKFASDFKENITSLIVSQAQFTQPLLALALEGISAETVEIKRPMDAYVKFVAGSSPYFLATQRDVSRLENRGMEVITKPLTVYNDLYQYIAVTTKDQQKRFYAEEFVNYLIEESVQQQLPRIGMLSPFYNVAYDNEHLSKMQNVNEFLTVSAFTSPDVLKEMQSISLSFFKGEKEALNKIKNMLV